MDMDVPFCPSCGNEFVPIKDEDLHDRADMKKILLVKLEGFKQDNEIYLSKIPSVAKVIDKAIEAAKE